MLGGTGVSRNHQGRVNSVSLVDGDPTCGEGSAKKQWPLPALLSGKKLPL